MNVFRSANALYGALVSVTRVATQTRGGDA